MGHHRTHSTLSLILSKHLDPFICYQVPVGGLEILGKARGFGLGGGRARRLLQVGAIVAVLWDKELAIRSTFLSCHPHHHVGQLHPATQPSPKKAFDGTTAGDWTASWASNHWSKPIGIICWDTEPVCNTKSERFGV